MGRHSPAAAVSSTASPANRRAARPCGVFAQEPALVVVALDTQVLGESVHWEEATNGGLSPHVCGSAAERRRRGTSNRRSLIGGRGATASYPRLGPHNH